RGRQNGSFLVADTGHHRLVEIADDLETVLQTIGGNGTGQPVPPGAAETDPELISVRGYADGTPDIALFNEPRLSATARRCCSSGGLRCAHRRCGQPPATCSQLSNRRSIDGCR